MTKNAKMTVSPPKSAEDLLGGMYVHVFSLLFWYLFHLKIYNFCMSPTCKAFHVGCYGISKTSVRF